MDQWTLCKIPMQLTRVSACSLWPPWKGQKVHEESGQRMLMTLYPEARTFPVWAYSPSSSSVHCFLYSVVFMLYFHFVLFLKDSSEDISLSLAPRSGVYWMQGSPCSRPLKSSGLAQDTLDPVTASAQGAFLKHAWRQSLLSLPTQCQIGH